MPQRLHALVLFVALAAIPDLVTAQDRVRALDIDPLTRRASSAVGAIHGIVRDDAGATIAGANVVAMGTTLAAVRSLEDGTFRLALPPGEYILRASREGYVSTFREPVRIQTSTRLERNITLIRVTEADGLLAASMAGRQPGAAELLPEPEDGSHAHSEVAWRLRHLFRTILRDEAPAGGGAERGRGTDDFRPATSFFDRALQESARAATLFFTRTDFSGQVDFLTTGSIAESAGWRPEHWSRGVAYAVVSAPVGSYGDWSVRGAVNASDPSSWVLLGEYRARSDFAHAFHVGMSYSVQGDRTSTISRRAADGRSVGAVFGSDRWRVGRGLEVEYGLRVDRYDYVTDPALVSPQIGVKAALVPGTRLSVRASQRVVAPGASEFTPPTSSGPWLPPERTFSSLVAGAPYHAEQIRHVEVGVEHDLGTGDAATLSVHRFHQSSVNQVVTLFNREVSGGAGHYRVATPGDVAIDGWSVRLAGDLTSYAQAAVEYRIGAASWVTLDDLNQLRLLAPSAVRTAERLHDLLLNLDAGVAETDTRVRLSYRLSSAFGASPDPEPGLGARFDIEVHQGVPYQPVRGSQLELLLAIRNLYRDLREEGSLYDELLTFAPPLRLMGGVRVRF